MYAGDNDGTLPGPARLGACASYDVTSSNELIGYLHEALRLPAPSVETVIAQPFVCPAYRERAPRVSSMLGRRCYLLSDNVEPICRPTIRPFGNPEDSKSKPLTYAALAEFGPVSELFAITDMDKGNVDPTVSWWADLPYVPVHGRTRNQLYFDWHVEPKKW